MPRIRCPQCTKPLRIEESMAGAAVRCPGCGKKFRLPASLSTGDAGQPTPQRTAKSPQRRPKPAAEEFEDIDELLEDAPDDQYEDYEDFDAPVRRPSRPARPARSTRQKRSSRRTDEYHKGHLLVIVIICLALGSEVLGLVFDSVFHTPNAPGVQVGANAQARQTMKTVTTVGRLGILSTLLTFLYLGHNWARYVLAVLYSLGLCCGMGVEGLLIVGLATGVTELLGPVVFVGFLLALGLTIILLLLVPASVRTYVSG